MDKKNAVMFSGSFNPVHNGHLSVAASIAGVYELWFVVSPHNPFKSPLELAAFHHRLNMVKIACSEANLKVTVSDIENSMPQPSYTVNTLAVLSERYPDKKWSLLIGSDNLANFSKWKDFREIADRYQLLVYPRQGYDGEQEYEKYGAVKINARMIDVSSSLIRENISDGHLAKKYLPAGVYEYIRENGLYASL